MPRAKRGEAFTFTVEGSGPFAFDMLRYDACWPCTEAEDSYALSGDYGTPKRRVVLKTRYEHAPTEARWKSMGWTVIGLGERRDPKEFPTPLQPVTRRGY